MKRSNDGEKTCFHVIRLPAMMSMVIRLNSSRNQMLAVRDNQSPPLTVHYVQRDTPTIQPFLIRTNKACFLHANVKIFGRFYGD